MKMIQANSKTYAGRLIREIRDTWMRGHGVYLCIADLNLPANPRVSAVHFNFKLHQIVAETNQGRFYVGPANWGCFVDNATGRDIVASRSTI